MKYFIFLSLLIGFSGMLFTSQAEAKCAYPYEPCTAPPPLEMLVKARTTIESALQVIDRSPYDIWNEHDLIIDGTTIGSMPQKTHPVTLQYEIKVNEYFKPREKSFQLITAITNDTSAYFEPNTRALFYLKQIEGGYKVSIYSVKTTQNCGARDLIQISPVLPNDNSFVRGAPILPWDYRDPCVPNYYSYDPDFWTFREYKPPLRQYKDHNIPIHLQMCDGYFVPVIPKSNPNHIACVKERSLTSLIERGWATMIPYTPGEIPSGIEISHKRDNLTMEVISSDWCSGLSLDKIPPNGLTKRMDWFGANALIITIGEEELSQVPHLKEMITEMKNSTGFKPHEFDEDVMVKQISGSGIDHSKIFDWLRENFEKQYAPRGDGSSSSFFQYKGDTYAMSFVQC